LRETPLRLTREKPVPYQRYPTTLGEHLRKRRVEQKLFQRQVATRLGIGTHTLTTWEKDNSLPEIRYWPGIIAFLGYDPHPRPTTLGERLKAKYRAMGLPRKEAARRLGLDEGTLQRYEEGTWRPTTPRSRRIIKKFLRISRT
jgi:transcriptional regulator with XRE-family HTH domain